MKYTWLQSLRIGYNWHRNQGFNTFISFLKSLISAHKHLS